MSCKFCMIISLLRLICQVMKYLIRQMINHLMNHPMNQLMDYLKCHQMINYVLVDVSIFI